MDARERLYRDSTTGPSKVLIKDPYESSGLPATGRLRGRAKWAKYRGHRGYLGIRTGLAKSTEHPYRIVYYSIV